MHPAVVCRSISCITTELYKASGSNIMLQSYCEINISSTDLLFHSFVWSIEEHSLRHRLNAMTLQEHWPSKVLVTHSESSGRWSQPLERIGQLCHQLLDTDIPKFSRNRDDEWPKFKKFTVHHKIITTRPDTNTSKKIPKIYSYPKPLVGPHGMLCQ